MYKTVWYEYWEFDHSGTLKVSKIIVDVMSRVVFNWVSYNQNQLISIYQLDYSTNLTL